MDAPTDDVVEAPLVMIEQFAKRYGISPEVISDIFCAGIIAFKEAGRLADDICPNQHFVKRVDLACGDRVAGVEVRGST